MSAVFGIVAPHPPIMVEAVGGSRSSVTSASIDAIHRAAAALAVYDPDLIVITSPHAPAVYDAFAVDASEHLEGSFGQFGAHTARFSYAGDPVFAESLIDALNAEGIPAIERSQDRRLGAGELDHGVLVPMSGLDPAGRWPLVVVSYSGLGYGAHAALGRAIRSTADVLARRVALVASGDLSHRLTPDAPAGYSSRGAELDDRIVQGVREGHLLELADLPEDLVEAGGECGLRSIVSLGGFAGEDPVPTEVLSYEGPWGVGYLTALVGQEALRDDALAYTPTSGTKGGMPAADDSDIVRLAREAVEAFIERGEQIDPRAITDPDLPERAGAFVTLHRYGELRGCIGTIVPTRESLAEEVIHNAIHAATRDPRFPPVRPEELADLDVKVDVLHAPEACSMDDLDPSMYGVIVSSGWRRGLLLPDLEGVGDVDTQVDIARRKGGIRSHEPCRFERFKVDRYT